MFENVTFENYRNALLRDIIPDENAFNRHKLKNVLYAKKLLPYATEREAGGLDDAVCMMIEVDYLEEKSGVQNGIVKTSESIDGYSYSIDASKVKTNEQLKMEWLRLFCKVDTGVI